MLKKDEALDSTDFPREILDSTQQKVCYKAMLTYVEFH